MFIKAEFYARGKVLLSSEYLVLFGATALALPTRLGQKMKVQELNGSEIIWNSYGPDGKKWFSAEIDLMGFDVTESSHPETGKFLRKLLKACCQNNSEFLSHWKKYKVDHYLEFPNSWGLGSSSTLIFNMASWADVNPYHLYFDVEQGSGYDVACAGAEGPILYTLGDGSIDLEEIDFKPSFQDKLFFIPLNQKTSSKEAVEKAKQQKPDKKIIQEASDLTNKLLDIHSLTQFENWIAQHESLISNYTGIQRIKDQNFPDFQGEIKSLGAWGGDIVLATASNGKEALESYFKAKGYEKVIPYAELIL
ncbi:MAG: GYDIA family GHMP kinase [Saprospiraceae bacterium]